jgi:predicted dehydrogenase
VPSHGTIHSLIEAGGIDAVVISSPTRFHPSHARFAAEAGLPALVEKPPALTLDEARTLELLKPSPWIGFNRRFDPEIIALKQKMPREGTIHLELHSRIASWKPIDAQDDVLLDLTPHLIDLAKWLTRGAILSARTQVLNAHHVRFELKLSWGFARIACSNDSYYRERIVVQDSQGRVSGSYKRGGFVSGLAGRLQFKRENPLVKLMVSQLEAFGLEVRKMSDEGRLATSADGLEVMSVIEAVRRSASEEKGFRQVAKLE